MNAQTVEWTPEVISQTVPRILKAKNNNNISIKYIFISDIKVLLNLLSKQGLSKSDKFILRY